MIYPERVGKPGEFLRLSSLESVMISGRLKMWGRWAAIGGGEGGHPANNILATEPLTKGTIKKVMAALKKSGTSPEQLRELYENMVNGNQKSPLAQCSDAEGIITDRMILEVFREHPGLKTMIFRRYLGRFRSKREIAAQYHELHPELTMRTCEARVDIWLAVAEKMLYEPLMTALREWREKN